MNTKAQELIKPLLPAKWANCLALISPKHHLQCPLPVQPLPQCPGPGPVWVCLLASQINHLLSCLIPVSSSSEPSPLHPKPSGSSLKLMRLPLLDSSPGHKLRLIGSSPSSSNPSLFLAQDHHFSNSPDSPRFNSQHLEEHPQVRSFNLPNFNPPNRVCNLVSTPQRLSNQLDH